MPQLSVRQLALLSVLTAVSLGIQLTPRPPNVEFTSLFTFLVGILYGSLVGGFFGGFVMFVNGFLSPWGFAGFIMPFQIVGMAIIGFAGGTYKRYVVGVHPAQVSAEVAVLGAFLTLLYDTITTVGVAVQSTIIYGIPWHISLIATFSAGALFYLVHIVSNTALFGSGLIPLIKALQRVPGGEALWSKKELLHSQH
ncbi:MAG: ECF transporter S component [Candidatus Bathyarchaeota archaeon]|nr:ECF transporter S component [Candidatus Bathyarchaeota archaeon]